MVSWLKFIFSISDEILSIIPNQVVNSFDAILVDFNNIAFLPHDLWYHVLKTSDKEKSSWRAEWQKRSKLMEDLRIVKFNYFLNT